MNQKISLLCVDDEPSILAALRRFCRNQGFIMLQAGSVEEAMTIIRTKPVSVVLSDFRMPQMNGLEFLREVHKNRPDLAGIILSGYADLPVVQQAIQQGDIYGYVAKPWCRDELATMIMAAARKRA